MVVEWFSELVDGLALNSSTAKVYGNRKWAATSLVALPVVAIKTLSFIQVTRAKKSEAHQARVLIFIFHFPLVFGECKLQAAKNLLVKIQYGMRVQSI